MSVASRAEGFDLFEIHVFHAVVNEPHEFGLELHDNYAIAAPGAPAELAAQSRVLHVMLEPTFGILPGWEVGAHLQNALLPNGTYDWGGIVLRSMYVFPHRGTPLLFAVNVEAGDVPARYEPSVWAGEIRGIAEYHRGAVDVDLNLAIGFALAGALAGSRNCNPRSRPATRSRRAPRSASSTSQISARSR